MIDPHPRPGDIGLTNINGPIGRLIRLGEWLNGDGFGAYAHAFVVLPNNQLIEADPGGAAIRPLNSYAATATIYVYPDGLTDQQRTAICDAARKYVGVPYGFTDYLALALHRFHIPAPGLRGAIAASRSMICSQLCDKAYQDAGIQLFRDGRWPGFVTPMALYDLLAVDSR
ncbi:hypothetical protein AV521_31300 [Streptomyces sp. IMTB 2501]|uniref:YiiX/YebB-like N1pC/P60 family cysteine hydrolase n=1 Tax=Streptomyces sp. IMTB 2501 TaxID=1776340 RepID=UPI0009701C4C|nr:YiiX/YebB-like N1pC/P60 family cysteine hydrolase [Streptomyces sp. IMTB 2501]OLZ65548.1 hypothetical protein AV521_31300 [Streptomyces sp. IMTB 2501]